MAELLAGWVILRVMQGEEIDTACLERALTLEDVDRPSHALMWPSFNAAVLHTWRHDVDRARPAFADVFQRCVDRGAESDLWLVLGLAMQAALWSGDVAAAEEFTAELADPRGQMTASIPLQALADGAHGIVAAWRGDVDTARTVLPAALAALTPSRFATGALHALATLGKVELSDGQPAAAAAWLVPAVAQLAALGIADPEVVPLAPDAAEALIALGLMEEAEPIVELLERTAGAPAATGPAPSAGAVAACCSRHGATWRERPTRMRGLSRPTAGCRRCATSWPERCLRSGRSNAAAGNVAPPARHCNRPPGASTSAGPHAGRSQPEPSSIASASTPAPPTN